MARMVNCIKLKKEAEGLDRPPYPGELGQRIWENVSKEAWAGWISHQTMLVNENRLNLADIRARKYLAQQMENYFFGDGADRPAGYVPQADHRHDPTRRFRAMQRHDPVQGRNRGPVSFQTAGGRQAAG